MGRAAQTTTRGEPVELRRAHLAVRAGYHACGAERVHSALGAVVAQQARHAHAVDSAGRWQCVTSGVTARTTLVHCRKRTS